MPSPLPNQPAIVAGNKMMLEAKIGGITPAIFSFSGRCELCPHKPCYHLPLGVIHQNLALSTFDIHHQSRDRYRPKNNNNTSGIENAPVARQLKRAANRAGQTRRDTGKNNQRNTVSRPRSVICSPSHIRNIVRSPRVITEVNWNIVPGFGTNRAATAMHRDAKRLEQRQSQCAVAGVLCYLAAPASPSFFNCSICGTAIAANS